MGATKKGACRVCQHVECVRIDAAHAAGVSFDVLAEKYGIPRSTLHGHYSKHVSAEQKLSFLVGKTKLSELRERAIEENMSVLDYLAIVRGGLMKVFAHQVENDSAFGASAVAGRIIDLLRTSGAITGEIEKISVPGSTVNVQIGINAAPGFAELQAGLLDLCRSHPGARADVIELLRRLDGTPDPAPRPMLAIEHERADA